MHPATPQINKNIIRNNVTGVYVNEDNYYLTSSPYGNYPEVTCNDITQTTFSGTTRGIWAASETFMGDLGTSTQPNGNHFSGLGEPVRNDGDNNQFDYSRYSSSEEDLGLFIWGTSGGAINTVSSSTADPDNACNGGPGVNALRVAAVNVAEMKDSLKLRVGKEEDLKTYQREIIKYHEKNNSMPELESYANTLNTANRSSSNTFYLYLMEHYRSKGDKAKTEAIKKLLKEKNPNNKEIEYQIRYYDVVEKIWTNPGRSLGAFPAQDSIELDFLAQSGSSISKPACLQLRMFTSYPCDFTVKEPREKPRKEDTPETKEIAYLGEAVPNPANNETTISYFITESSYQSKIRLTDIVTGRLIAEIDLEDKKHRTATIDLTNFISGVYVYTLVVDGEPVDAKKIVIVK